MPNYSFKGPAPYQHQITTTAFLIKEPNRWVTSEPGTGKTRSLLCAADLVRQQRDSRRVLYVCPDAVCETIAREADLWTDLSATVLRGTAQRRANLLSDTDTYFYVINYEGVNCILKRLLKKEFDILICDESTRIRTHTTQRHKNIAQIRRGVKRCWLATGTPMPRDPFDFFGQMKILDPRVFGCSKVFKKEYLEYAPHPEIPHKSIVVGYRNQAKLKRIVAKHSIRYLKSECLDLPPKVFVDWPCPMTRNQKKIYDQVTNDLRADLPSGGVLTIKSAMGRLMRNHQVASGFLGNQDSYELIESGKLDGLMDLLDTLHLHEHKVIIWCWYVPTIWRLSKVLEEHRPAMFFGDRRFDKDAEVQRFNLDPGCRVMIGNARVGIGCTANVAPYAVYYDLPYFDTEAWLQSQDRNHRIGQTADKVTYYKLMSPGVDNTIWRNLSGKFKLQDYYTGDDMKAMAEGTAT